MRPGSETKNWRRVLIANRGEIAVRVIRACQETGLEAVAVFSEADRRSPHVWLADRAVEIGPAVAAESYLSPERILDAAKRTAADAVHPGYGFLAENASFAEAVEAAGLAWVGPPPRSIRIMGEKTSARRSMATAKVPVIPGTLERLDDITTAGAEANRIGYPVLLKAAAGGGGKGMRVVEREADLKAALAAASREAAGAFGDSDVYMEKYLPEARHIEIQVIADATGHAIHLGERECSLQRRHQKVIEEAPAPGLSAELRNEMGRLAVAAAQAVDYVGAGTVEFLMIPTGEFYFLEMNTRIQVEHPVTEMVTGVDLVGLQLEIAAGGELPLSQAEVELRGHAIECRIAAEDATGGFLPATGTVTSYREPGGVGVRFDSGIEAGVEITPHYDPLLAKCIGWGRTRGEALSRVDRALAETEIGGLMTNLGFLRALLAEPAVAEGQVTTRTLERRAQAIVSRMAQEARLEEPLAAALAAWRRDSLRPAPTTSLASPTTSDGRAGWRATRPWVWYR
jgi:3-methylcrotonyl-CoA carboxylase alpha subunit